VNEREREALDLLRLRIRHVFDHSHVRGDLQEHHHLNVEAFTRALERYIDARLEAERHR